MVHTNLPMKDNIWEEKNNIFNAFSWIEVWIVEVNGVSYVTKHLSSALAGGPMIVLYWNIHHNAIYFSNLENSTY